MVTAISPAFQVEVAVIGAGVVGLAVARSLAKVGKEVLILDKAASICAETSSRNSEVIHAGLYYPASSLKAKFCVEGKKQLLRYCRERHVPVNHCGKLIVATTLEQLQTKLPDLKEKANRNGVLDVSIISKEDVKHLEPEVNCFGALLSPSTAVFDSHTYSLNLLADAENHGATLALHTRLEDVDIHNQSIRLCTDGTWFECKAVVNSAGLWASKIAKLFHKQKENNNSMKIWEPPKHYFAKGTYFRLEGKPSLQHLIYPIPEPGGLGIHATIDWSKHSLKFGPDVEWLDPDCNLETIDLNPNPSRGQKFYSQVQKYWPGLQDGKLVPDYVGIRPKLHHPKIIDSPNLPFMDFSIKGQKDHGIPGLIHLFGIESPGLTSSLAIGDYVRDILLQE